MNTPYNLIVTLDAKQLIDPLAPRQFCIKLEEAINSVLHNYRLKLCRVVYEIILNSSTSDTLHISVYRMFNRTPSIDTLSLHHGGDDSLIVLSKELLILADFNKNIPNLIKELVPYLNIIIDNKNYDQ